ncbi:NAD(P)H dehydrogenase (quinone), putative [Clostridium sp. DL-VIII]|uniref:flavodoxin family protein n=1 Tax=Clostridium sp. DL-VIII TaxID=641107 RepID=UPI00023B0047|nr:flavodoxin family protein [Clostridium sp. DL-VIII]EHI99175.1 NAD(P)H dehydrogenase (quinone), putative [Clostridium sp. DL-VIII]
MSKILFMNTSPDKNGNTFQMGTDYLKGIKYDTLQMADYKIYQYGQVFEDDQIKDVFISIKTADTLVIGSPVYWYSVGGLLKTFFDRIYMLPEAKTLRGKKLYFFA